MGQHAAPLRQRQRGRSHAVGQAAPHPGRGEQAHGGHQGKRPAPAGGVRHEAVQGHAEHRGQRPAQEHEGDGPTALGRRCHDADGGRRLRGEHRRAQHAAHPQRQQPGKVRRQCTGQMAKPEPDQRRRQQAAAVPSGHGRGQQRRSEADNDGARSRQLARHRDRHLQRAHDVVECARGHHHAAGDGEIAQQQGPARGAQEVLLTARRRLRRATVTEAPARLQG
jgi:hypothetical protein